MPTPGERTNPTLVGKEMTDSAGNGGGTVDQALEFVKADPRHRASVHWCVVGPPSILIQYFCVTPVRVAN
jgi:hypothetical protein